MANKYIRRCATSMSLGRLKDRDTTVDLIEWPKFQMTTANTTEDLGEKNVSLTIDVLLENNINS